MKYAFSLVLLVCFTALTSCSLITRLNRNACGAPPNLPTGKFLLFGDQLGSVEDPAFVGRVVCFRASKTPTALGLEIPTSEQDAIDRYLGSNGDAASRANLLSGDFWQKDNDGRASAAMFKLIEHARRMKQQGRPLTVFAFSEGQTSMTYTRFAARSGQSTTLSLHVAPNMTYDAFMAKSIRAFHARHPDLQIVALMGNAHAGQAPIWVGSPRTVTSTGYLLRDLGQIEILLQHHAGYLLHPLGSAWFCQLDFCGVHKISNVYAWVDARQPGFYHDSTIAGYSITYVLPSLTASPPAIDVLPQKQPGTAPGAAAQALSFVAIEGVKLAIAHGTPTQPELDKECVLKLDDHALAGMFEEVLNQHLTRGQLADANHFYSTPLGDKINQFALQQALVAHGQEAHNPVSLSPSETAKASAFATSVASILLTRVASLSNPETAAKLRLPFRSLLLQCQK